VEANDEEIAIACESVRTRGFVNYFGTQRFGTGSVPTFRIGHAALRGDFKTAIDLILQPRPNGIVKHPKKHNTLFIGEREREREREREKERKREREWMSE
jgi:tRNA(Glu) U13 pseudouridine synthase TruD